MSDPVTNHTATENPNSPCGPHDGVSAEFTGLRGKVFRGSVFSLGSQGVRFVVQTGTTLFLAAYLGPDEFGVVAIAASVQMILGILPDSGLPNALIQKTDVTELHRNSLFWAQCATSALVAIALILVSPLVSSYMEEPRLTLILALIAIPIFAQGITGVQDATLRKDLRFGYLMMADTVGTVASGVVAVTAVLLGAGIWSLVLRIVVYPVVRSAMCWFLSDWRPKLTFSRPAFASLWSFGKYVFFATLVGFGLSQFDSPIITKLAGVGAAGAFFMARTLAVRPIEQVLNAVSRVLFPSFSLIQDKPDVLRSAFCTGVVALAMLTWPALGLLYAVCPEAIPNILGERWSEAVLPIQILCLQGVVLCSFYPATQILYARGRSRAVFVVSVIRGPAILVSFAVGAYYGGVVGVAVAYTVAQCAIAPISVWLAAREIELKVATLIAALLRPLVASAAMLAAVRLLVAYRASLGGLDGYLLLACELVLGLVVYLVSCMLLMPKTLLSMKRDIMRLMPSRAG